MYAVDRSTGTLGALLSCAALAFFTPSCGDDDDDVMSPKGGAGGKSSSAAGGSKGGSGGNTDSGGGAGDPGGFGALGGAWSTGGTGGVSDVTGGTDGLSGAAGGALAGAGGSIAGEGGSVAGAGGSIAGEGGEGGGVLTGGTAATGGAPTGGAPTGGAPTGGAPTGGAPTGGAPTGGASTGGSAPTGGNGNGGLGGAGAAGSGGSGTTRMVWDFENGHAGWEVDPSVVAAIDSTHKVTGASSLKLVLPALTPTSDPARRHLMMFSPHLWAGNVVTVNVWVPVGIGGLYIDALTIPNGGGWHMSTNSPHTPLAQGAWNTWTYTVPNTMPNGVQAFGIEFAVPVGGQPFPGGTFYVDSITATGGTETCSGSSTATFDFDSASTAGWASGTGDTVLSPTTDKAYQGTGSLKVAFTNLPAAASAEEPTKREVGLGYPNLYCGQRVTFRVWAPLGIDFRPYAALDNYRSWTATDPASITHEGWTTAEYTVPEFGPGGINGLGIQFLYTNTTRPFSGAAYIDYVVW